MANLKQQQDEIKLLKAQIDLLKASGASMFSSWTSDKGNTFLSFKPSKGRSILMTKLSLNELLANQKTATQALSDFNVT